MEEERTRAEGMIKRSKRMKTLACQTNFSSFGSAAFFEREDVSIVISLPTQSTMSLPTSWTSLLPRPVPQYSTACSAPFTLGDLMDEQLYHHVSAPTEITSTTTSSTPSISNLSTFRDQLAKILDPKFKTKSRKQPTDTTSVSFSNY